MPDGAVIIAAITSCTNTSNPRNVIAAGLLARNANRLGLVRASPGSNPRSPRGPRRCSCTWRKPALLPELEKLGFGIVGFACTTCNGMSGALDPAIQQEVVERDLYSTAVLSGNRNFDGRIHPYAKQAFLASPPLVVAYAIAGTIRFDIERDVLGIDKDGKPVTLKDIWPSDEEIDADRPPRASSRNSSAGVRARCSLKIKARGATPKAHCTTGARKAPISAARLTGKAHWPGSAPSRACVRWRCWATTSPPITCRPPMPSWPAARPVNTWQDGPAGGGLQFLRHPSGRPPDRPARHLRQPAIAQRNGARRTAK